MEVLPRVSVVVLTHDGDRYVREQVRSILDQSILPAELVISDDGSEDSTLGEVSAAIAAVGPRARAVHIKVDSHERLGLVPNLARAISQTSGEVVALADQDDVWARNKIEVISQIFARRAPLAVFSDGTLIDEQGKPTGRRLWQGVHLNRRLLRKMQGEDSLEVLLRGNFVTGATMACDRRLLDVALPVPADVPHDAWLALLAGAQHALIAEPTPLIKYRVHSYNTLGLPPGPISAVRQRRTVSPRSAEAAMFSTAAKRLTGLGSVDKQTLLRMQAKVVFSSRRQRLPKSVLRRIGLVAVSAVRGDYSRFSKRTLRSVGYDMIVGPTSPDV